MYTFNAVGAQQVQGGLVIWWDPCPLGLMMSDYQICYVSSYMKTTTTTLADKKLYHVITMCLNMMYIYVTYCAPMFTNPCSAKVGEGGGRVKLAGNLINDKKQVLLVLFFFKKKNRKNICNLIFCEFF
jgi:hypothetical protein